MGYLGHFYDRNDRTSVCKDNSDNIILFYWKPVFYITINSYISHILHGHLSGNPLLVLNLKALRYSDSFISLDTKSNIFGPR